MEKKIVAILLLALLASCKHGTTKQEKAEAAVNHYLDSTLNDPKSYESVSFGHLHVLKDSLFKGDTVPTKYGGRCEIIHTYRAKNALGGVITTTDCFQLDSTLTIVQSGFDSQYPATLPGDK